MLNKKVLAAAIVGGLFAGNAFAAVDLNATTPAPLKFASELKAPVDLTAAGIADNATVKVGYNFSVGEVRYGRLECTNNIKMASATVASSDADFTVGAVNGINTNALFFSLTNEALTGATDGVVLTFAAANTLTDYADVKCSFSIYDQPSQAQAGGTGVGSGQIYTTGFKPYISRASGVTFAATEGKATADVGANPAYTAFLATGKFGELDFSATTGVLKADASQIALADIFDDATTVTVTGDLSAADDLTWSGESADDIDGNVATFAFDGAIAQADLAGDVVYAENGDDQILVEKNYVAKLNGVANTNYVLGNYAEVKVGEIVRNGTELQAPLVQVPGGWIARIALTNTGSSDREYTIRTLDAANEDNGSAGKKLTLGSALQTGTLPKNGTKVIKLDDAALDLATGGRRGTVIVTVDAPSEQIQGLYQIVNPANGLVNNTVLIRPDSN